MNTIREFYNKSGLPKPLQDQKIKKFEMHPDIASEFEYWIECKEYKGTDAVCVEGYTAKRLAEISDYLNGDGAFSMLLELRENPKRALEQISKGFKRK